MLEAYDIVKEDVATDSSKPYYILIDDLDRNWIDRSYVYDLIDALVEVVAEFAQMKNVKVIVALRQNIMEQLFAHVAGKPGAQREKYETLSMPLRWKRDQLVALLEERVQELTTNKYHVRLGLEAVMPKPKRGKAKASGDPVQYLVERTLMRPRDLIVFFNLCLHRAVGENRIGWKHIWSAETEYSQSRIRSITDEWNENYPGVQFLIEAFMDIPDGFTLADIPQTVVEEILDRWDDNQPTSFLPNDLWKLWEQLGPQKTLERILQILFKTGFIGARIAPNDELSYCYDNSALLEQGVPATAVMFFHPCFHNAIGVNQ